MILVDTSVWVDHLRASDAQLAALLNSRTVVMHPFVVGELACGNLSNRALTLGLLNNLPCAVVAQPDEVLVYVERHRLQGKGIGYVDVHWLASVAIASNQLWTRDKRLLAVARQLGLEMVSARPH